MRQPRTTQPGTRQHIALVPAAGSGSRMGGEIPKQYLSLLGRPLIAHTLDALAAVPVVDRVVLVISPDDARFDASLVGDACRRKLTVLACGGQTRAESVRNGLVALQGAMQADDWVLVHDAARPCITDADVTALICALSDDPVGGLLAVPVADTLKRADAQRLVVETVPREMLWRAQTPQMFRYGLLTDALGQSSAEHITDEASAVERLGLQPKLVPGNERNIKVTYPADLALAATYLAAATSAAEQGATPT